MHNISKYYKWQRKLRHAKGACAPSPPWSPHSDPSNTAGAMNVKLRIQKEILTEFAKPRLKASVSDFHT